MGRRQPDFAASGEYCAIGDGHFDSHTACIQLLGVCLQAETFLPVPYRLLLHNLLLFGDFVPCLGVMLLHPESQLIEDTHILEKQYKRQEHTKESASDR